MPGSYATYLSSLCLIIITVIVIGPLLDRVWYRILVGIQNVLRECFPGDLYNTAPSFPTTRLPYDIVELIIAHLIHDMHSLRACSLTCYSWRIAAIPHLYHTLTIETYTSNKRFLWQNCLQYMDALGLLSRVKRLCVHGNRGNYVSGLSPMLFIWCVIRQPLASTNIQELEIKYLDIPTFMPWILRCSRNFFRQSDLLP